MTLKSSFGRRTASMIIACTSLCLASSEALAQQVASAMSGTSTPATSWSVEASEFGNAPHLVIAMAEPEMSRLSGSDLEVASDESNNDSSASRLPTRLSDMNDGLLSSKNSLEPRLSGQRIQTASLGGTKIFSLLDSRSESFRYEPRKKDFGPDQWSVSSVAPAHEVEPSPRALFQVQVGSWRVPVMLSAAGQQ